LSQFRGFNGGPFLGLALDSKGEPNSGRGVGDSGRAHQDQQRKPEANHLRAHRCPSLGRAIFPGLFIARN
jgi:hypothetical protein